MNAARRSSLLCPRVLQIASQPWDSSLVESVGRLLLSSIANSAPTGESMQFGNVSDLTGTAKRQPSPQQYGPPTAASTPSRRAGVSARPGLKKAFPRWPGQPNSHYPAWQTVRSVVRFRRSSAATRLSAYRGFAQDEKCDSTVTRHLHCYSPDVRFALDRIADILGGQLLAAKSASTSGRAGTCQNALNEPARPPPVAEQAPYGC